MALRKQIAFVGNSLPRRCGIATFTTDLQSAVAGQPYGAPTSILAMTEDGQHYDYPPSVSFEIVAGQRGDYVEAAERLNAGSTGVVSLQHEFGIFGGEAGGHILDLTSRLNVPIVTTLHTVLESPSPLQSTILRTVIAQSARVVVMAEKARSLLTSVYKAQADKIRVIPHGIPEFPFVSPDMAKAKLGFAGRTVILTFGLLSPGKGIEVMIDAMPQVLKTTPEAIYVVLGATHPNLLRDRGEAYRESLVARVAALGLQDNVVFLNQFVDKPTLLDFISSCDIYVTPYLNPAQMTSGTLAYSYGLGKVVVSTPYWHARELLADGRGILVPFGNADTTGREIAAILTDAPRAKAMRKRAYAESRTMTWTRTAGHYLNVFDEVQATTKAASPRPPVIVRPQPDTLAPAAMQTAHFMSMCDDTGLFQHAVHSVPDRHHGYCVDDNARALLVCCALTTPGEHPLPDLVSGRFAAFIQHAWNPDTRMFRNFMGFDRRWLEPSGSEDSHGRTLWALGQCAANDASSSRRNWATALFMAALPTVIDFTSPRAWAFTLLGLDGVCAAHPGAHLAHHVRELLAERLYAQLVRTETRDWVWFEDGLSYDNARLSQALLVTGMSTNTPTHTAAGLRTFTWLTAIQTAPSGAFRPVGSDSFGDKRMAPRQFDQQPLEAAAQIAASRAAWLVARDPRWRGEAERAFGWFKGLNDLSLPLVDNDTGSCRDGLHPDRANENRGGESAVSYLLGLADLRWLQREAASFSSKTRLDTLSA